MLPQVTAALVSQRNMNASTIVLNTAATTSSSILPSNLKSDAPTKPASTATATCENPTKTMPPSALIRLVTKPVRSSRGISWMLSSPPCTATNAFIALHSASSSPRTSATALPVS